MAEKENNQRHESTIYNYFVKTSKGFDVWAEENIEGRSYLQIALDASGDTDEVDFHIAFSGKINFFASGIAQAMLKDEFLRSVVLTAARNFFINK